MTRAPVRKLEDLKGRLVFVGGRKGLVKASTDAELTVRVFTTSGPQRELPDEIVTVPRADPSWRLVYPPKKRSPA